MSKARAILFGALGITVISLGFAAWYLWLQPRDTGSVTLEISKPEQIALGQPFTITASIANSGKKPVSNVELIIALPDGIAAVGSTPDERVAQIPVGDLAAGTSTREDVKFIALKDPQTIKHIEAKATYAISGDSAQFEAPAGEDIMIGDPALTLSFVTPSKIVSGQDFEMTVVIENTTEVGYDNLSLRLNYAPIFTFKDADPEPTNGSSTWAIVSIPAGTRREIKIRGSAIGPEESFFGFHGELTILVGGYKYLVNVQEANLAISLSPLSISVRAGDGSLN
ncbi:MAG TPA: hypothetical protein VMC43_00905, partial [Candidatus Paceibacterota bacterium]|nr:hypothetical protein [Candidatus Paceibacterota bacterium]